MLDPGTWGWELRTRDFGASGLVFGVGSALELVLVLGVRRYVLWNIRNVHTSGVLSTFCNVIWFIC